MGGRSLTIDIPIAIPSELNPNWQPTGLSEGAVRGLKARAINALKFAALYNAISARNKYWWQTREEWPPLEKATIEVTIILAPRAKVWDETNVRAALKPLEDGVVKAGIIRDDKPDILTWLDIKWERSSESGLRVEIKEEI